MFPIFDSHAHYDSEQFNNDRDGLIRGLKDKGVGWIINAGSDIESSRESMRLAEKYDFVWFAAGVHPHEAEQWNEQSEKELYGLLLHKKCVAVGEIGLDYHYDFSPREKQREVFERQINIALQVGKPVVIHDREANGDMYDILRKYAPLSGVMHCFSGSAELMVETVRMGLHIGLGGAVTFANARHPISVAAGVPEDRLLLETDCPYMTPVPHRGRRNDSSMIAFVAEKIAQVRGCGEDRIRRAAAVNASGLFGIALGIDC